MERDAANLFLGVLLGGATFFGTSFLWGFCFPPSIRGIWKALVLVLGLVAVNGGSVFSTLFFLGIVGGHAEADRGVRSVAANSFAVTQFLMANAWWAILALAIFFALIGMQLAKPTRSSK